MDLLDDRKRQVVTAGETRAVVCDRPSVAGSVTQRACSFCGSRVVLWAGCTRSTVSARYRRPGSRRSLQAAGETVLKPPGSSLEHTPDLQRSPAVKED